MSMFVCMLESAHIPLYLYVTACVSLRLCFVLQHRMRPDIARLLTPHIYSELENHPSVLDYDNIKVRIVSALLLCLHSACFS